MKSDFFDVNAPEFSYPAICIVEGKDDAMFVEEVLKFVEISKDSFRIIVCKGKSNLFRTLNLMSKTPSFQNKVKTVSVVFDADDDVERSLKEIQTAFDKLSFPKLVLGDFVSFSEKSFGVFLLPSNDDSGELEDVALSIAHENPILKSAIAYIDDIDRVTPLSKTSKRKVQVFLAGASTDIRQTVGWAFRDGTIPLEESDVEGFAAFIRRQFELSGACS